jgi:hypothetical protein
LAALAACQAPATAELAVATPSAAIDLADFPAPRHLLRGFDERQPEGPFRVGDEVLLGLRLRKALEVRNWLLQLRVLEATALDASGQPVKPVTWSLRINGELQQFASQVCRVEVIVMDEYGLELGRSQPCLPSDFLSHGMAAACRFVQARRDQPSGWRRRRGRDFDRQADLRPLAEATVAAVALLQVVQEDSVLAPILWQIIEKPSIWSVVANMGAKVMLRPSFHLVSRAESPVPKLREPAWHLPLALEVNQQPALNVDLLITDATPPFSLAGGLLGATASHPTDATRELSLLLLSARRR